MTDILIWISTGANVGVVVVSTWLNIKRCRRYAAIASTCRMRMDSAERQLQQVEWEKNLLVQALQDRLVRDPKGPRRIKE